MANEGRKGRLPFEVVDELQDWLRAKIGNIAEDDWLLLDDFEGHCDSVRREWRFVTAISVANPDVKRSLERRCASNLHRAQAAFEALIKAWILRRKLMKKNLHNTSPGALGLSGRILQALLDRGMTQAQIATKLGVHRSHISRVKSGEHELTDAQLDRIEAITGVPLGLLMLGSEPPPTTSKAVREVYREALDLLRESELVRQKLLQSISAVERAARTKTARQRRSGGVKRVA